MKLAKLYALVVQLFVQLLVVTFGGYYLTKWLTKNHPIWPGIVAVICALMSLVYFIIIIMKQGEKDGEQNTSDESSSN